MSDFPAVASTVSGAFNYGPSMVASSIQTGADNSGVWPTVADGAAVTIPIYPDIQNPKIYFIPNVTATVCVV